MDFNLLPRRFVELPGKRQRRRQQQFDDGVEFVQFHRGTRYEERRACFFCYPSPRVQVTRDRCFFAGAYRLIVSSQHVLISRWRPSTSEKSWLVSVVIRPVADPRWLTSRLGISGRYLWFGRGAGSQGPLSTLPFRRSRPSCRCVTRPWSRRRYLFVHFTGPQVSEADRQTTGTVFQLPVTRTAEQRELLWLDSTSALSHGIFMTAHM